MPATYVNIATLETDSKIKILLKVQSLSVAALQLRNTFLL